MSVVLHHSGVGVTRQPPERRSFGRRMRRIGLGVFFTSIAVNAAIGIYAVLAPNWEGETHGRILLTSLCVTGAVLLALACEPAWERSLLGPVPGVGAVLGVAAFAATIVGIWLEPASDVYGKAVTSTFAIAIACVLASLLALAPLAPAHRWIFKATLTLLALGTLLMALLPWFDDDPPAGYVRGMGVVLILLAAFMVTVPVMHWIDRGKLVAAEATDAIRFCPHCGKELAGEAGIEIACGRCGREFTVTPHPST